MPNKAVILKIFTKELILNSVPGLKEKIKKQQEKLIEFLPFVPSTQRPEEEIPPAPPELARLPIPGAPTPLIAGINFSKLTGLIQNPTINTIECPGPYRNIIYRTYNIRKSSPIALSREEMQDLVMQFSRRAKVPVIEGLFRAWVDKFLISATIQRGQTTNFILQKVIYPHFV